MPDTRTAPSAADRRPPIDPRIRERRLAVRRDEGRRRLRVVLIGLVVLGTVAAGWGLTRSPVLDIDRLEVRGARHTPAAEVLAASGLRRGRPMTDVDEPAAAAGVAELPWVATAAVSRRWPGTVRITVKERRPAASVRAAAGGWMLVDRSGRFVATAEVPAPGLPAIEGAPPATRPGDDLAPAGRSVLDVALAIPAERVARIPVVARLDDGTVELRLATPEGKAGGVVRFGPPEDLGAKLRAVFTVLDRVDTRQLAVLDVRVPDAPVVTRRGRQP